MKSYFLILFLFIGLFNKLFAQPIPTEFKSCVVFIYFDEPSGEPQPDGTGFYIGKRIPNDSTNLIPFLVTAKHVLKSQDGRFVNHVLIRLNTRDSIRYVYVPINLAGKNKNTFFNDDSTVDLAVIAGAPGKKDYDLKVLPEDYFISRTEYKLIPEGTDAFFIGLFTSHIGERHNYPIFRFGHLALSTSEKILFDNVKREMAVIETNTYGGNSGSPIFYKIFKGNFNWNYKLGGLVNGYFGNYSALQLINTNNQVPATLSNIGIAAVTPSYFITDILNGKEVGEFIDKTK